MKWPRKPSSACSKIRLDGAVGFGLLPRLTDASIPATGFWLGPYPGHPGKHRDNPNRTTPHLAPPTPALPHRRFRSMPFAPRHPRPYRTDDSTRPYSLPVEPCQPTPHTVPHWTARPHTPCRSGTRRSTPHTGRDLSRLPRHHGPHHLGTRRHGSRCSDWPQTPLISHHHVMAADWTGLVSVPLSKPCRATCRRVSSRARQARPFD